MLGNFNEILNEIQKMQQQLKNMTVEARTEKGTARVVMNGHQEVVEFNLDPKFIKTASVEEIQKVVSGVFERAIKESKQMVKDEAAKITGGLGLPNIPGLF
ncbi:YbaB/EbfC family nucleoid-associated protein [Desulfolucanica intricata]|uniref:YbaB/EbfC family nucleoid-associated protein n=1 Tax=Desulfolucanica intricata TaxID=1285191 RepID=UPI0008338E44|nr:YbaB/EbfC family nucleoid-associated protein [Desulfolucanica intricata]